MAAHQIPDEMRRKIILSVRVTEAEAERLRGEADAKGLAIPDYLRHRLTVPLGVECSEVDTATVASLAGR
jgi:hypothetical protein